MVQRLLKNRWTWIVLLLLGLGILFWFLPYLYVVNSVPHRRPVSAEELREVRKKVKRKRPSPGRTPTDRAILRKWANRDPGDWYSGAAKGRAPRVMLARLALNKNVDEVNRYLQKTEPVNLVGSSWELAEGDHDFTMVPLTTILYLFGDRPDRLYPETRKHLLENLLIVSGGEPKKYVPNTLGLVFDTENHILMTESSRFLKNQWIYNHRSREKRYNNAKNGLEDWLAGYLNYIRVNGFYEFNSVPYQKYAVHPLLNLAMFARGRVGHLARAILDDLSRRFALGSLGFRQVVPFRRQFKRAGKGGLRLYGMCALARVWTAPASGPARDIFNNKNIAVVASALSYRPPKEVLERMRSKKKRYLARIGHGPEGSPEIHSGGPGYLLSAGGVFRGRSNKVVPRPTTLLLPDGAEKIEECFHIPGKGPWTDWNNTGVHRRFAVGNHPVSVPDRYEPVATGGGWSLFRPGTPEELIVAVWNHSEMGLIGLFPEKETSPDQLLGKLQDANDKDTLRSGTFRWPDGGTITFDVDSPPGRWVITAVDSEPVPRNYDEWPLLRVTENEE